MDNNKDSLYRLADEKVLVLDGALGTMIQSLGLTEADFRGDRLANHGCQLAGCNDVLCLTRPEAIADIHRQYLEAGADIIETNSFNANSISLADYDLGHLAAEINRAAARVAVDARDAYQRATGRRAYVAGSMGPTNKSLTMAVTLGESITWDDMVAAYLTQAEALISAGVDLLIIETIFDSLNAKAAIYAARQAMESTGREVPIILSVTLTESGRTLSGQTLEAFVATTAHADPFAVGLNCGFGIDGMIEPVKALQNLVGRVSVYANAGLPDNLGRYNESPEQMAATIKGLADQRLLNIVGGCCGTTPAHIAAIARAVVGAKPRERHKPPRELVLAGLEPLTVSPDRNFVNVGERCNVAGSRKFLRLVKEGNLDEALDIARAQAATGAQIIDVNMDDGLLDAPAEMSRFVKLTQVDPEIARVPLMVDSSDWQTIIVGLKAIQGKPVVNSISLKEGEERFIEKAAEIKRMGAAMVVMAFDEQGQATSLERKIEICRRSYDILTRRVGVNPVDIIFDPNILSVATGLAEHSRYALNFLEATEWIKTHLPGAKVSGGLSNLSFAFRGNNTVREAMHAIFLSRAIKLGMDMAIVNAAALPSPDDIDPRLAKAVDDVIIDSDPEAADRLVEIAQEILALKDSAAAGTAATAVAETSTDPVERLKTNVSKGLTLDLETLVEAARARLGGAVAVINGPLMGAMDIVGQRFGEGKIFLPQVVKSAAAMKAAVDLLTPYIEAEKASGASEGTRYKMVMATVKGDVHDIGKNITAVIMRCNGFDIEDLGVMVPADRIVEAAKAGDVDAVGLSGLITPSLEEMRKVAGEMQQAGLRIPLFIGGATTSDLHTALKIAPLYDGPVARVRDAASTPVAVKRLLDPATKEGAVSELKASQQRLRDGKPDSPGLLTLDEARALAPARSTYIAKTPSRMGRIDIALPVDALRQLINWRAYLAVWGIDASLAAVASVDGCDHCRAQWLAALPQNKRAKGAEAMQLIKDGNRAIDFIAREIGSLTGRIVFAEARTDAEGSIIAEADGVAITLPTLRQQKPDGDKPRRALSDLIADGTTVALFAATVGSKVARLVKRKVEADDYTGLVYQSIADRLAEAATELLHRRALTLWGYTFSATDSPADSVIEVDDARSIRPAVGYPSLPDQSLIFEMDKLLDYNSIEITPTDNGALNPSSSTTGLIIVEPAASYFMVGAIGDDQRAAYFARHPQRARDLARFLPS